MLLSRPPLPAYFSFLSTLIILSGHAAVALYSPCSICPGIINHSNRSILLPGAKKSTSCFEFEAFAKAGCLSSRVCNIAKDDLKSTCCAGIALRNSSRPIDLPSVQCSEAPDKYSEEICFEAESAVGNKYFGVICLLNVLSVHCGGASLDGGYCRSCSKTGVDHYVLDCSNVNSNYLRMDVLGYQVTVQERTENYNSGNSENYSSDGVTIVAFWLALVVLLTTFVLAISVLAIRYGRVNRRPQDSAIGTAEVAMVSQFADWLENFPNAARERGCKAIDLRYIGEDSVARTIHEEAAQGHLDTFIKEIEKFRGEGSWDMRWAYTSVAVSNLVFPNGECDWDELVMLHKETLPQVASAIRVVQGEFLIHKAWEARGSGWRNTVTEEGRRQMKMFLEQARDVFLEAVELDPQDPSPFAGLQKVGMGLSDRKAAEEWLTQARARDKYNFAALNAHLYLLMQKWHGTYSMESVNFARFLVDDAECPRDHPV